MTLKDEIETISDVKPSTAGMKKNVLKINVFPLYIFWKIPKKMFVAKIKRKQNKRKSYSHHRLFMLKTLTFHHQKINE